MVVPVPAPRGVEAAFRSNLALLVGILALLGASTEQKLRAALPAVPDPLRELAAFTVGATILPVVLAAGIRR